MPDNGGGAWYTLYLLYWYKSTDTDAEDASSRGAGQRCNSAVAACGALRARGGGRYSLSALAFYWHKSTHSDAAVLTDRQDALVASLDNKVFFFLVLLLRLLAVLVQKYRY